MAVGKKTGGRKKGSRNKASVKRQQEVAASGKTPLDYMLDVLRDPNNDAQLRFDAAKASAPFVHPRLANIEHTGKNGAPLVSELSDEQLQSRIKALVATLGGLAGIGGASGGGE